MPIDYNVLKAKAQAFAEKVECQECKASDAWLKNFRMQNALILKKLCGESSSVNL